MFLLAMILIRYQINFIDHNIAERPYRCYPHFKEKLDVSAINFSRVEGRDDNKNSIGVIISRMSRRVKGS